MAFLASRWAGDLALLALSALWGLTFVVVKDALAGAGPFTFLVLRFAVGAAVLSVLAGRRMFERAVLRRGLVLSLFLFGGYAFQTTGLQHTTPSRSAFITGLFVLVVPVVAVAFFRRALALSTVGGIALAVGGMYLLTRPDAPGAADTLLGDALTLGCAITYAFHIAFNERWAPGLPAKALVAVQLWAVALLSVPGAVLEGPRLQPSPALWGAVAFCGLFASALAISVQTWAQARTTAVHAALLFTLEPVFAAAYSVAMGHETLDARALAGAALMIAGTLVAELGPLLRRGQASEPPQAQAAADRDAAA